MDQKNRIINYMNRVGVEYTLLEHRHSESLQQTAQICGIDPAAIAQAVFLDNSRGPIMAVIPLSHVIRLDWVESLSRLKTRSHKLDKDATLFNDCEPGTIPPVAIPYGVQAIIDNALLDQPMIYFRPGRYDQLIRIHNKSFFALHRYSIQGDIAERVPTCPLRPSTTGDDHKSGVVSQLIPRDDEKLKESIGELTELPAMPDTALKLLPLHGNPDAGFHTLAEIIGLDASLSAQLLHYANSSYFPHHHEITNIEEAIRQSIGFNTALNLALAISISKVFNIPKDGPIGLSANWIHAILSAELCQELVSLTPQPHKLDSSTAYLAGLLHDIGFLLLGHLRRAKFNQLNRAIKANPEIAVVELEQKITGVSHPELGATLLRKWGLPEPLITAAQEHHNHHYSGKNHLYPALIRLSEQLLKDYDIGDADSRDEPDKLYKHLNIDRERAIAVTEKLMQKSRLLEEASLMASC